MVEDPAFYITDSQKAQSEFLNFRFTMKIQLHREDQTKIYFVLIHILDQKKLIKWSQN